MGLLLRGKVTKPLRFFHSISSVKFSKPHAVDQTVWDPVTGITGLGGAHLHCKKRKRAPCRDVTALKRVGKECRSRLRIQYEAGSRAAGAQQSSSETEITPPRAGTTPRWRCTALPSYNLMGLSILLLWIRIILSVSARRGISTKATKVQSLRLFCRMLMIWWEMETSMTIKVVQINFWHCTYSSHIFKYSTAYVTACFNLIYYIYVYQKCWHYFVFLVNLHLFECPQ